MRARVRTLAVVGSLVGALLSGMLAGGGSAHARALGSVTSPANLAVQYAMQYWNYNKYDGSIGLDCQGAYYNCVPEAQAQQTNRYQPDFQCAEFVARALAAEGLLPGLSAYSSGNDQYGNYNGYDLLDVGAIDQYGNRILGLYDYLVDTGRGYDIGDNPASAVPGDVVFYYSGTPKDYTTRFHVTIIVQAGTTVGGSDTRVDSHNTDEGARNPDGTYGVDYYSYGSIVSIVHINADAGSMPTRVANDQNGAMDIFARGTDYAFWHIWQNGPNGGWNSPASLGGVLPSSTPAVAANLDGSLQVFGRGSDGAMWYNAQGGPNGGWNGGWISLGGLFGGDASEAISRDGRVEIFAPNRNGTMYTAWQNCPGNGCGWSGWSALGNPSGVALQTSAAARNLAGPLEVFSIGSDNGLWHAWQTCAGCGWTGWSSLGGIIVGTPAVAESIDGRLEVFARTSSGAIWTLWQNCPGNGCGWSGWSELGNPSGVSLGDPAVVRSQDGRFELFAAGSDGAIWTIWQNCHGCGWSGWASLGKPSGINLSEAAAARSFYGELEAYGRGSDGAMWTAWQTCVGCGWTGWTTLGGSFA